MKDGKIKIEVNGKQTEYDLITDFEDKETSRHYYLYTDNEMDEDGDLNIFGSYTEKDKESLNPIESDEEWEKIDNILDNLLKEDNPEVAEKITTEINGKGNEEVDDEEDDIETITLTDENGNEKEYEILLNFQSEENDKYYIVYTDNEKDEDGDLNIFALRYDPDDGTDDFYPVDDEELEIINKEIQSILDEE